jgi:hypothetical protein
MYCKKILVITVSGLDSFSNSSATVTQLVVYTIRQGRGKFDKLRGPNSTRLRRAE